MAGRRIDGHMDEWMDEMTEGGLSEPTVKSMGGWKKQGRKERRRNEERWKKERE